VLLEDKTSDPRALLRAALEQFTACRANSWIAADRFLLARAEIDVSNKDEAAAHIAEALRTAREFSLAHLVRTEATRAPEVFQFALTLDIETDYIRNLGVE